MIPHNRYPYTDLHELNLDYVLSEMAALNSETTDLEERVAALEAGGGGGGGEPTLIYSLTYQGIETSDITQYIEAYMTEHDTTWVTVYLVPRKPDEYLFNIDFVSIAGPIIIYKNDYIFIGAVPIEMAANLYYTNNTGIYSTINVNTDSVIIRSYPDGNTNGIFDVYVM